MVYQRERYYLILLLCIDTHFLIINLVTALIFGLQYVTADDATQFKNNDEEVNVVDIALRGQKYRQLASTTSWVWQNSTAQWSGRSSYTSVVVGNNIITMGGEGSNGKSLFF